MGVLVKKSRERIVWYAYCCGGRARPMIFKTRREAEEWIALNACDGTAEVVRATAREARATRGVRGG
jgi:hypothetical protein